MGAALVGGIIAGAGALLGGAATAIGSKNASDAQINYAQNASESDKAFTREMTDKAWSREDERFAKENEEYDRRYQLQTDTSKELLSWLQEKFNSPEAQARALRAAGISPSVIYGGGSQSPFGNLGLPEIASPSTPSYPNADVASPSIHRLSPQFANVGEGIGQGLTNAASLAANVYQSITQSEKISTEDYQLQELFAGVLKRQQQDIQSQETKNAVDNFNKVLLEKYGDKTEAMKLISLVADAYEAFQSGDLNKFQAKKEAALANVAERSDKIDALARSDINFAANLMLRQFQAETELKEASVVTEKRKPSLMKSQEAVNYAESRWKRAMADTEDRLREGRFDLLTYQGDIAYLQRYLVGNDVKFSDDTLASRTYGYIADMNSKVIGTSIAQEELNKIIKENRWYERHAFADYCLKWSYVFNNVVSSFVQMRGQNMRFDAAKERNAFQHEFNQMWKDTKMSDVKNAVNKGNSNGKGVGSILDYVPDADRSYYESIWQQK